MFDTICYRYKQLEYRYRSVSVGNDQYWQRTMSNVKLSKSAASVTDNDANNNNNGHVTVAHTSYRDATASDVVTDQPERSMN